MAAPAASPQAQPAAPPGPFWLAVGTVGLTLVLILMGALVTSTGSGLAFLDWPLSDGELMPERSLHTLPGFLEHFHRVVGAVVGLMAIGVVVLTWRSPAAPPAARSAAVLGLVLVIVQGVVGGVGVLEGLPVLTSATHGTLAQVTMATFAVNAYLLSPRWQRTRPEAHPGAGAGRRWTAIAVVFLLAQTVLGAIARHTPAGAESVLWTHVGNAFVVFLIGIIALGVSSRLSSIPGLSATSRWLMGLLLLQVVLGFIALLVRRGKHPENIEYLWRATLISGHVLVGALLTVLAVLLAAHVRCGTLLPGGAAQVAAGGARV